jgi:hypothetical protein
MVLERHERTIRLPSPNARGRVRDTLGKVPSLVGKGNDDVQPATPEVLRIRKFVAWVELEQTPQEQEKLELIGSLAKATSDSPRFQGLRGDPFRHALAYTDSESVTAARRKRAEPSSVPRLALRPMYPVRDQNGKNTDLQAYEDKEPRNFHGGHVNVPRS